MNLIPRMSEVAAMMGNESRLILLQLISEGEKSVESLSELSGLPVASTSQQLQILKKSRMVTTRRDGKRILYRLEPGPLHELIDSLEKFAIFSELKETPPLQNDGQIAKGEITLGDLQLRMKKGGLLLVDVRSREEFKKGHIPDAIHIPFSDLKNHKFPKNKEVVVYCRGPLCVLSVNAFHLLRSREIPVRRLESGYAGWLNFRK